MTALTWLARLIVFAILVVFALQNTDPVSLRFLPDMQWQAPLVMTLLVFFAAGVLLGVLSLLGLVFRQRREIACLKRPADRPAAQTELPPVV